MERIPHKDEGRHEVEMLRYINNLPCVDDDDFFLHETYSKADAVLEVIKEMYRLQKQRYERCPECESIIYYCNCNNISK